jgi:hypothetical protein
MKKLIALLTLLGLALLGVGLALPASATQAKTTERSWLIAESSSRWAPFAGGPQTVYDPASCGNGLIQVDIYKYDTRANRAIVDALDDDGLLTAWEDSQVYISHTWASQTPCVEPTPTPTPTPEPTTTPTPTPEPTPEPTVTPEPTPTPTPEVTPSPTPTPTPTTQPTPTPSSSPSLIASPSAEPSPTPTPGGTSTKPSTPSASPTQLAATGLSAAGRFAIIAGSLILLGSLTLAMKYRLTR